MPISSFADLARLSLCPRTGTKIEAYFIYSIVLTVFIYPIVVHWGWGSGFLSAWGAATGPLFSKNDSSNGMIDFAGSGIVHMVGGRSQCSRHTISLASCHQHYAVRTTGYPSNC